MQLPWRRHESLDAAVHALRVQAHSPTHEPAVGPALVPVMHWSVALHQPHVGCPAHAPHDAREAQGSMGGAHTPHDHPAPQVSLEGPAAVPTTQRPVVLHQPQPDCATQPPQAATGAHEGPASTGTSTGTGTSGGGVTPVSSGEGEPLSNRVTVSDATPVSGSTPTSVSLHASRSPASGGSKISTAGTSAGSGASASSSTYPLAQDTDTSNARPTPGHQFGRNITADTIALRCVSHKASARLAGRPGAPWTYSLPR